MTTTTDHRTLLALRRWAATALDRHLRGDLITTIPDAPAWAWQHLATHDRVATSLVAACSDASLPIPDALRQHALRDGQQRLLLLARLHEVTAIAAAAGIPVLLLKGTADLGDPLVTPSGDLDLFVRREQLRALADALVRAGWSAPDWQTPTSKPGVTLSRTQDPVTVDVHAGWFNMGHDLDAVAWNEPMAIPTLPGHCRPATRLHAWHLLTHGALQHPERRGGLRDAWRLHRLVRDCTDADRAWISARVEAHPERELLADDWQRIRESVTAYALTDGGTLAALLREQCARYPLRWTRLQSFFQTMRFALSGPPPFRRYVAWRMTRQPWMRPNGDPLSAPQRIRLAMHRITRVALALVLLPMAYRDMATLRRQLA